MPMQSREIIPVQPLGPRRVRPFPSVRTLVLAITLTCGGAVATHAFAAPGDQYTMPPPPALNVQGSTQVFHTVVDTYNCGNRGTGWVGQYYGTHRVAGAGAMSAPPGDTCAMIPLNVSAAASPASVSIMAGQSACSTFVAYPSGGNNSYSYAWSGGGAGNPQSYCQYFGTAGTYAMTNTVTARDGFGQTKQASATVTVAVANPIPPLGVSVTPQSDTVRAMTVTKGDPTCITFNATPTGGEGPYTYSWSSTGGSGARDEMCKNVEVSSSATWYNTATVRDSSGQVASQQGHQALSVKIQNPIIVPGDIRVSAAILGQATGVVTWPSTAQSVLAPGTGHAPGSATTYGTASYHGESVTFDFGCTAEKLSPEMCNGTQKFYSATYVFTISVTGVAQMPADCRKTGMGSGQLSCKSSARATIAVAYR